jgi:hypothetical protein
MSNTVTAELRAAAERLRDFLVGQGMQNPQVVPKDYFLIVIVDPTWSGQRVSMFEDCWEVRWRDAGHE